MRILRRTVMVTSLVAGAFGLAALMLLAALHTDAGRTVVRDRLVALLADSTGGRVTLAAVETLRPGTIVLRDLVVSLGPRGVLRAKRVELALDLPLPLPPVLRLRRLRVDGLAAHLVAGRGDDDRPPSTAEHGFLGFRIRALEVRDARLGVLLADDTRRHFAFSGCSLEAALASGPRGTWLTFTSLTATPRGLPLEPLSAALTLRASPGGALAVGPFALASGTTRLTGEGRREAGGRLDVLLHAEPLASNLLARVAPGMRLPEGSSIDLVLRGPPSALVGTGHLDLAAAGVVTVRGRGDATGASPYRVAIEAHNLVPGAFHPGWPRERFEASFRGRGQGKRHLAQGRATTEAGTLVWRGRAALGTDATYRVSASGQVRDLARFTGTAGRFPFRIEGGAAGALARPERVRLALEIGPGTLGTAPIRQASARAHLTRGTVEGDLDVTLARGDRATATITLARERRGLVGHVRTLRLLPARLPPWTSEAPASLALDPRIRLDDLHLRSGAQRAVLSAAVGPHGALDGALAVTDLELAPFCDLAGAACAGRVSGRLEASGTAGAPRFAITVAGHDVAAGPITRSAVDASVRLERGRATGTVAVASLGGRMVAAGSVPAPLPSRPAESDALDLTITARDLALARLAAWAPGNVSSARGHARADLHVGGTWTAPRPQGTIALHAPLLELTASGARWEDVHLVLRADGGTTLAIERLTAAGGAGKLVGSGRFDFGAGVVPVADVRLTFDRFLAVDRPVLEAAVDGTLRIDGPLSGPRVRGRLYVPEGALHPAFLPAANASTERDPTIEVVGLPEDGTAAAAAGLGELTLGLTITLGNGMRIRRRDADIQLGGTLRIERTPPEAIRVSGTVEIERGWYTFSGRRFTVRGGAVRFGGGPVGDAELDLEATRRTGEYDVVVAVQGTVARPELLLSSDPPLDEPDVLAVLLVGRPSGELSDSERLSVQAEAASLAIGYVVPGLAGAFEDTLPLEQVQLSPEQLRVGHRIGDDVFVSLSQQFVGWTGQTVSVEYAITRRLSVELSTSSRGSGAIDFFWRRRY